MPDIRVLENIDRRVLGAIRLIDNALGDVIEAPLRVSQDRLDILRNRSGLHVIRRVWPQSDAERELAAHAAVFDAPPAQPPVASVDFDVSIQDPSGRYLPRGATISLPRRAPASDDVDPLPEDHLFMPIEVEMMRAPNAPPGPNWAGVRASLAAADASPLFGALVRVIRASDDELLGQSIADERGEVFVPIAGVPVVNFTEDETETEVGRATVATRLEILTLSTGPEWPANPDAILADQQAWVPTTGDPPEPTLRTGTITTRDLSLVLTPSS